MCERACCALWQRVAWCVWVCVWQCTLPMELWKSACVCKIRALPSQ